nr:hypothetical protein GCM10020092_073570 [Actinoplanes digitatis]
MRERSISWTTSTATGVTGSTTISSDQDPPCAQAQVRAAPSSIAATRAGIVPAQPVQAGPEQGHRGGDPDLRVVAQGGVTQHRLRADGVHLAQRERERRPRRRVVLHRPPPPQRFGGDARLRRGICRGLADPGIDVVEQGPQGLHLVGDRRPHLGEVVAVGMPIVGEHAQRPDELVPAVRGHRGEFGEKRHRRHRRGVDRSLVEDAAVQVGPGLRRRFAVAGACLPEQPRRIRRAAVRMRQVSPGNRVKTGKHAAQLRA